MVTWMPQMVTQMPLMGTWMPLMTSWISQVTSQLPYRLISLSIGQSIGQLVLPVFIFHFQHSYICSHHSWNGHIQKSADVIQLKIDSF